MCVTYVECRYLKNIDIWIEYIIEIMLLLATNKSKLYVRKI